MTHTSVDSADAGNAASYQQGPTVLHDATGMLRAPRRTFTRVIARPRWAALMLLTLLLTGAARMGVMSTDVGRQAVTDQWVRRVEAFGRQMDDGVYAQLEALGDRAPLVGAATAVASGP